MSEEQIILEVKRAVDKQFWIIAGKGFIFGAIAMLLVMEIARQNACLR